MSQPKKMILGIFPKLPAKYLTVLISFLLSGMMSAALSLANILIHTGLVEQFFMRWFGSWLISWLIAFPTVLIFLPLVRRVALRLVDSP